MGVEDDIYDMTRRIRSLEFTRHQADYLIREVDSRVRQEGPVMQSAHPAPDAFAEDAKRLAELRQEMRDHDFHCELADCFKCRKLESLIAVYEECAARGLTFGGSR